ncbi:MAG: CoA transferase [Candidatus Bathyarchaeota archaeon]|jgi:crotonobetainyl-CoA:carnitine CoA-transferase CaiB-like acyl-CoA transferase|nr:CoA transferase [Candidatus Bathyarchaeota archaeon]
MALPLEGKVILDLCRMLPGPYCSMILGDLGAEVIRIEDPNYAYSNPPPFYQKGLYRESAFHSILMRNKKSITLNLKKDEAREIFYKLTKRADVVLDTFRPKVMHKLKIDYETLSSINPSIICCSLTGYGQYGPYEQIAGHDLNYIGICGILDLNKERKIFGKEEEARIPLNPGVQVADIGGGLVTAIGILGAIIERDKNPERRGQYVDISMTDSVFSFIPLIAAYNFSNDMSDGINLLHGDFPFYNVYQTKDNKFISVGVIEEKFWREFCKGLQRTDLIPKRFALGEEREELFKEIELEFLQKTQKEWMEIFINLDACVMPVKSFAEACQDPQIKERNMVVEIDHPKLGKIHNVASPIKYSRTPLTIRSIAPKIGQNTKEILTDLGYSVEQIRTYQKNGII